MHFFKAFNLELKTYLPVVIRVNLALVIGWLDVVEGGGYDGILAKLFEN